MFRNPGTDAIVILVIVLLIFGPKRLPLLGRELGRGMREFKDSITGNKGSEDDEEKPAISASSSAGEAADARAASVPEPERASADAGSEPRP
jgi:sec-independent protein translocase protein TatA